MTPVLVDSNALVAQFIRSDEHHQRALDFLQGSRGLDFLIPAPVLIEATHLMGRRAGPLAEAEVLLQLVRSTRIENPELADYTRAADLMARYADFPIGVVDALLAAMAERLDIRMLFTFDRRHFRAIRPAHCEAFELVP